MSEIIKQKVREIEEAESKRFAAAMGFPKKGNGRKIMREGRRAFDPHYNSADKGQGVIIGADPAAA